MSDMTNQATPSPAQNGPGLWALRWLADQGALFCRVTAWNDGGKSPGKRPFEKNWQKTPLSLSDVLPHINSGGNVGLLCGEPSGGLCLLDADERYSELCVQIPLLGQAPAIIRPGADKGKILIRVEGGIPDNDKWYRPGEKHPFFEFLSTGNQGVIPPSIHPAGVAYELVNTDCPIPVLTAEKLSAYCMIWTGKGLNLASGAPAELERPPRIEYPNGDGLREKVLEYWTPFKVFEHFGMAADVERENQREIRLKGNGGLLIRLEDGAWSIPSEGKGTGGGAFEAWQYAKTGDRSVPKDHRFTELLREMADAAGIDYQNTSSRNGNGYHRGADLPPEPPADFDGELVEPEPEADPEELFKLAENASAVDRPGALQALQDALIGAPTPIISAYAEQAKAAGLCTKTEFVDGVRDAKRRQAAAHKQGKTRQTPPQKNGLPAVKINGRFMRDVANDCLQLLEEANRPPVYFVRSGDLVQVRTDERRRPSIGFVTETILRGRLDRLANFYSEVATKDAFITKPAALPLEIVRDILGDGETHGWSLPALDAITECPTLRADGSVITDPGYDHQTALFYHPAPGLEVGDIPENPTREQIDAALKMIQEAIGDFPYDGQESRANALALLLTPIVRPAIDGQVPLATLDAPQAGTGKTLLASLVGGIVSGNMPAIITAPKDPAEWRKKITSTLMTGATVITIDNLTGTLYAGELAAALTTSVWSDRVLGSNDMITLPQRATWLATGNNIRLGGDLPRRCYWIRLDAKMSRPWQREGFKHPDLLSWVLTNRGKLIAAALTLARGWYAAGCPAPQAKPIGGFGEWSRIIGGILEHAGVTGFLGNLSQMYETADDETPQWEGFLLALAGHFKDRAVTIADICSALTSDSPLQDTIPEILDSLLDDKGQVRGRFKTKLGHAFRLRNGTRYGDSQVRVERAGADRTKAMTWKFILSSADGQESAIISAEDAEDAEDTFNPEPAQTSFESAIFNQNVELPAGESNLRDLRDLRDPLPDDEISRLIELADEEEND